MTFPKGVKRTSTSLYCPEGGGAVTAASGVGDQSLRLHVNTTIAGGADESNLAGVTVDNALKVAVIQATASGVAEPELTRLKLYRGFLENNSSSDLNIDASIAPVQFEVAAQPGFARWVTGVRVLLNDISMEINTNDFRGFGSGFSSGLPNGIKFFVSQGGVDTNFFIDPIKAIGDFLNYCDDFTNLVNSITSQEDFLSFDFDFDKPVVLPPDTPDRVVFEINDDLTSVNLFKVVAKGYQEVI